MGHPIKKFTKMFMGRVPTKIDVSPEFLAAVTEGVLVKVLAVVAVLAGPEYWGSFKLVLLVSEEMQKLYIGPVGGGLKNGTTTYTKNVYYI